MHGSLSNKYFDALCLGECIDSSCFVSESPPLETKSDDQGSTGFIPLKLFKISHLGSMHWVWQSALILFVKKMLH